MEYIIIFGVLLKVCKRQNLLNSTIQISLSEVKLISMKLIKMMDIVTFGSYLLKYLELVLP